MAMLLKGAPVAAALNEKTAAMVEKLKAAGTEPTLAILRVGERESDLSYERGAAKRCEQLGVALRRVVLPADTDNETLFAAIEALNSDVSVHGILMFNPLPRHLDGERARQLLSPAKDIDGCTDGSMAGVFSGGALGFPPCTARAAMEILDHYGIACSGKRAAVIGRSLVVGRPAALMLMHKNATVTVCHTKTVDMLPLRTSSLPARAGWRASARSTSETMPLSSTSVRNGMKKKAKSAAMCALTRSNRRSRRSPRCPAASAR